LRFWQRWYEKFFSGYKPVAVMWKLTSLLDVEFSLGLFST
jgi:hypothetical protein